jgi:hypothetical protein
LLPFSLLPSTSVLSFLLPTLLLLLHSVTFFLLFFKSLSLYLLALAFSLLFSSPCYFLLQFHSFTSLYFLTLPISLFSIPVCCLHLFVFITFCPSFHCFLFNSFRLFSFTLFCLFLYINRSAFPPFFLSKILRCNCPAYLVNFRQLSLLLAVPRPRNVFPRLPPLSRCYVYAFRLLPFNGPAVLFTAVLLISLIAF